VYSNQHVARVFEEIRDILNILGEEHFRVRAYQLAALRIQNLSKPLVDVIASGEKIPGVGKNLLQKAKEIMKTGTCKERESLRYEVPDNVLKLLRIPGVGPKTVAKLHFEYGINSLDALEKAVENGRINLSPKMREKILKGLPLARIERTRFSLGYALNVLTEIRETLTRECSIHKITFAGSARRHKSTVRDGDILVVAPSEEVPKIIKTFVSHPSMYEIQGEGETKASIRTEEGFQVDLRVVPPESWGAAVNYFTGSKQFNIKLRTMSQQIGNPIFINEYGYFQGDVSGKRLGGETEEQLFELLGIQYVPPELREDTGEVELAREFALPHLIELQDIKGDLHVHSTWSDGTASLEELTRYGDEFGYEYLAVCDHTKSLGVAGGCNEHEFLERNKVIDTINTSGKYKCKLLKGVEVEVLKGGSLDFTADFLKENFDLVTAAVHTGLDNPQEALQKTLRAIEHPAVHCIAHPTGRQFGRRDEGPLEQYWSRIVTAAAKHKKWVELNCDPGRLDPNEALVRKATEAGVPVTIGTDAHFVPTQLRHIEIGAGLARRAWCTPACVVNALPLRELRKRLLIN